MGTAGIGGSESWLVLDYSRQQFNGQGWNAGQQVGKPAHLSISWNPAFLSQAYVDRVYVLSSCHPSLLLLPCSIAVMGGPLYLYLGLGNHLLLECVLSCLGVSTGWFWVLGPLQDAQNLNVVPPTYTPDLEFRDSPPLYSEIWSHKMKPFKMYI